MQSISIRLRVWQRLPETQLAMLGVKCAVVVLVPAGDDAGRAAALREAGSADAALAPLYAPTLRTYVPVHVAVVPSAKRAESQPLGAVAEAPASPCRAGAVCRR